MSKKDFSEGLGTLLDSSKKETRGRPKTSAKVVEKSSEDGTKENETRATFIVNKDQLATIKALAYWERKQIKDVVGEALSEYLDKHPDVKPIPGK